jgi:putative transposase
MEIIRMVEESSLSVKQTLREIDIPRSSFYTWYRSHELKKYLETHEIRHVRTQVYHPMAQGKIERYPRSMKNLILSDNYYAPAELTERIREWVEYYNHQRYHEAIDNLTPADKYYGRDRVILKKREKIRRETMKRRRELNRMAIPES